MTDRITAAVGQVQSHRRFLAVLLYGLAAAFAYGLAFQLRFEFAVPPQYLEVLGWTVIPLVTVRLATYRCFRLTRERWRYVGPGDVARLAGATALGSVILVAGFALVPLSPRVPLSVLAMEAVLTCFVTAGMWLSYRLGVEQLRRNGSATAARRVLIIGAGEAGHLLAREMLRGSTRYRPVGFVDDEPRMRGATVQGLVVAGSTAEIQDVARRLRAEEIAIAVPSAGPEELRRIVSCCEQTGLSFKVLPGITSVLAGDVSLNQLREVRIEDLLGREPIQLELPELAEDLTGITVLVTGAAGSIGSELSRQVALHRPSVLVLMDQAETDLFYLELELKSRHPHLNIVPVIGDVAEAAGVERVFRRHRPDRVFHAAAYKHVPMMEANVREAVRNNVIGTWRVADAAGRHGCGKFVLVSTDKAVRPANVMGATKRLAELVVINLQQKYSGTTFGAVRFGNVLGSNGSVLPIFRRQLAEGKPLTVTHPETTRYFMTIPEAVQLILQASLLPSLRGRIAMLDMGEPVRIAELARNLLRLSGLPVTDRIVYTGLRPGEKLHEELSAPEEEAIPTDVPKVRLLSTPAFPAFALDELVRAWDRALREDVDDSALAGFYNLFPALGRTAPAPGPQVDERPVTLRIGLGA